MEVPKEKIEEFERKMQEFDKNQKNLYHDLLRIGAATSVIGDCAEKSFELQLITILFLHSIKQDITPMMGHVVDHIVGMIKDSASEVGLIRFLSVGEAINEKELEEKLEKRIEGLRAELRKKMGKG